jgi:hypothetical protein
MKKKSKKMKLSLRSRIFVATFLFMFLIFDISSKNRAAILAMEKQERARIIALADLKERMKGKEAMALEQGKKMAEIAAEV